MHMSNGSESRSAAMTPDLTKVMSYSPLISPERLQYEIYQSEASKQTVRQGRADVLEVIQGTDERKRLLVAVGPCSIHDPFAAREYALQLRVLRDKYRDELEVVMRSYTEKPRTRGGWKGLINDPDLDNSFRINKGLRVARQLFADITDMGVPLMSELLDTISPQYLADFLSVGAVGARTTECQLHRELVSGSSFPVGFKNATDGSVAVAIDAIEAAKLPHHFLGITKSGTAAVVSTSGNADCFLILRGGKHGPNYDQQSVHSVKNDLLQAGRRPGIMVDCSHGNSEKNFKNQPKVAAVLAEQIAAGDEGILGIMIESNIHEGSQKPGTDGLQALEYGVSVTDGCIGWQETERTLERLAHAVKLRRSVLMERYIEREVNYRLQPKGLVNGQAHVDQIVDQQSSFNGLVDGPATNGLVNGSATHGLVNGSLTNGLVNGSATKGLVNGSATNGLVNGLATNGLVNGSATKSLVDGPATNGHAVKLSLNNLYQLIKRTAENSKAGVTLYPPGHAVRSSKHTTYRDLFQQSRIDANLILQIDSINPGSKVLIHFNEHSDNIRWFWAVIVAGCLPVMSTPFVNDLNQRRKHLVHVNNILQAPTILTSQRLEAEFLGLEQLNLCTIENIKARDGTEDSVTEIANRKGRDDPAAFMLTSGSTGNAKAVCLRHGQILTALEGKSRHHETDGDSVFLNWIGMDHVASLIEIHLHAMSLGAAQIHAPAADVITDPISFLTLIHQHKVTYAFAPNFFLASLRVKLDELDLLPPESHDLDLSSLRALISGGESNVVETCAALTKQLHRYHAIGEPIRPGFGMTETCAGSIYGKSCPSYDLEKSSEFASLGTCIPGIEMRVVKDDGTEAAISEVGDLQLSGPVLFTEYFNNVQATTEAFTPDGWFITGDRANIDERGCLNLSGRAKESIIINGVKHFPHELEAALEEALIPGLLPSYTAVFPYRPRNSETETLCVVYVPIYGPDDVKARADTADAITNVSVMVCGVRPYDIIPLERFQLPKTSLGKLSRTKIRSAFETGMYEDAQKLNNDAIRSYRTAHREKPSTRTEGLILSVICDRFGLAADEVGINSSLFDFGVTSVDLIAFKRHIQDSLALEEEIPLITVLTNPTVRGMSNALDTLSSSPQPYSPVITLRTHEGKTPLWLVHPGVGEILVFLNLAQYITDRSVYALRARGFNEGEEFFGSIEEVISIYHENIKKVQPEGPYAIAGYSFGAMLAFEITKIFESQGDRVAFLGSFNLPPHIKMRMQELDWVEVLLNLSYFLDLTTEEYAHEISAEMHKLSNEQVMEHVLQIAPPERLQELSLDSKKLGTWASLAHAMQYAARDYDPSGTVASIDVFYANPLLFVAKDKEDWVANHLSKWKDFTRSEPRFHEVPGAHYTMMSSKHVLAFDRKLKSVLSERGL